jgi:hypothetical protein
MCYRVVGNVVVVPSHFYRVVGSQLQSHLNILPPSQLYLLIQTQT